MPFELSTSLIIAALLAGFFVLGKAADLIVVALTNLGKIFKISAFALSFVLLGLTTSLPEMVIGAYAAADNVPRLAFGNLLGGIIVLLTLVIGLNGLMFGKIAIDGKFARYSMCKILPRVPWCNRLGIHDLGVLTALLLSPALLFIDGTLSRVDGAVLVALYLFFVFYYLKDQHSAPVEEAVKQTSLKRAVAQFIFGAVILMVVARMIVNGSEALLSRFEIPAFVFGMLVLGIGTNLPELTIMLRSRREPRDVSAGNILGSAAANIMILGALSIFTPLSGFGRTDILLTGWTLTIVTILLMILFRTKNELNRGESLLLILLYLLFFVIQGLMN
ncbi:sodium:calcium antiporter [Candidatus Uhrbacteria bacterium]|nr:sodium:calcium antiporter [Candidatus Uhrbacteria bacterium]